MLTIRDAQIQHLQKVPVRAWLLRTLCELLPDATASWASVELGLFVDRSVSRGKALGFGHDDLLAWVALEFALGERFEDRPENGWAAAILSDRSLRRADAIQQLREQAILRLAQVPAAIEAQDSA
jgi:hypothetical protein